MATIVAIIIMKNRLFHTCLQGSLQPENISPINIMINIDFNTDNKLNSPRKTCLLNFCFEH
jgi:hypothetical protein